MKAQKSAKMHAFKFFLQDSKFFHIDTQNKLTSKADWENSLRTMREIHGLVQGEHYKWDSLNRLYLSNQWSDFLQNLCACPWTSPLQIILVALFGQMKFSYSLCEISSCIWKLKNVFLSIFEFNTVLRQLFKFLTFL